jgi:hypothetical protein
VIFDSLLIDGPPGEWAHREFNRHSDSVQPNENVTNETTRRLAGDHI